eukprot:CAMPEP_0198576406 /NCGR_PEP_ID=MMETSP1462-20131121/117538_1 /TAXON_ID=1333877 /ORGANISM="Brandtodinium nutriculum, Strain RCC3387" /LENGTH=251 /DNA_ID=CAMNT_0044307665 /DNA_START=128 /DNA_END=883 /DNA_ORIENTATION=-
MTERPCWSRVFIAFFRSMMPIIQFLKTYVVPNNPKRWWYYFEAIDSTPNDPAPRGRLCLLGDSDVHYWGAHLPTPEAVVVGVVGAEMPDIAGYAARFVEKYEPKAVILTGGANDFMESRAPADILEHMKAAVAAIPRTTRIIYFGTKPELVSARFWAGYKEYDQLVRDFVETTPNVVYVNNEDDMQADSLYRWDGLHFNEHGYELWNCKVKALLRPGLPLSEARRVGMDMSKVCPTAAAAVELGPRAGLLH